MKSNRTQPVRKLWQKPGQVFACMIGLILAGCSTELPTFVALDGPSSQEISGFVVSDSPRASLIAAQVLENGGFAADAAVAGGFALAVTLPSRAGLGGGGACLYYDAEANEAQSFSFLQNPPNITGEPSRFSTAVPGTVRGLFVLQTQHGKLPWATVVAPSEALARFGSRVSRGLASDLAERSSALVNDRSALDNFMTNRRQFLAEGQSITLLPLAGLLGRVRSGQAGAFYSGSLAQLMAEQAQLSGGVLSPTDLDRFRVTRQAIEIDDRGEVEVTVPAGEAVGAASLLALDTFGNAAACVFTMGKPFGAGLMVPDFGFLLSLPPGPDKPSRLRISIEERKGVVEVSTQVSDESEAASIRCASGVAVRPETCAMTLRPSSFGLGVQGADRL